MPGFLNYVVYVFLFSTLYFEVFMLVTYLENRGNIKAETERSKTYPARFPTVSIFVPVWNEETTIISTIESLLQLDYPKDKISIIVIDDGSTDTTWFVLQKYLTDHSNISNLKIYHKENGGKHTALNYGLSHSTSEFVGCLDADSFIAPDALRKIMHFFTDKSIMAVTPSVRISNPKNILQMMQKVEYVWGLMNRKIISYLNGLYVTPGPFSIFRRQVFQRIGPYRQAHNTEDMELAMRMQTHHMKIATAHNAYVYTIAPSEITKLYKQRLRWTYGFINNAIDYRHLFFNKKYGNVGIFVLPVATISVISGAYMLSLALVNILRSVYHYFIQINTTGFSSLFIFHWPRVEWFYINTEVIAIISLIAFLCTFVLLLLSRKMADGKVSIGLDVLYFLVFYAMIAPFWLARALINTVFNLKTNWR